MLIGFCVLFLAAAAGAVLANDMTVAFLSGPERLGTWQVTLHNAAHGHANMFAILHVLFGLTLPYSRVSHTLKVAQTAGLTAGTFAMGPLLWVRAGLGPTENLDLATLATGGFLAAALAALMSHAAGIGARLFRP